MGWGRSVRGRKRNGYRSARPHATTSPLAVCGHGVDLALSLSGTTRGPAGLAELEGAGAAVSLATCCGDRARPDKGLPWRDRS